VSVPTFWPYQCVIGASVIVDSQLLSFEPQPFARTHQDGHRQQLNAKFIWTARLDRLLTIVAQKRTHLGGQFRVFGAMRCAQPMPGVSIAT